MVRAGPRSEWAARQVEASERFLENAEHSAAARGCLDERRLMLLETVHHTRDYLAFLATWSRDIDDSVTHTGSGAVLVSISAVLLPGVLLPLPLSYSWLHIKK